MKILWLSQKLVYANRFSILGFEVWQKMFYGCVYSIVLNSHIYFCLVLRKSKEGWRPLRLCLGQRTKKYKLSVQLEALNTPALMGQTFQGVNMESRNSQDTLWKKTPWERSALTRVKRSLDDAALERLTPRARANFLPRRGHTRLTPVGLTSSGAQPVSITRPKKKACRMATSPEF